MLRCFGGFVCYISLCTKSQKLLSILGSHNAALFFVVDKSRRPSSFSSFPTTLPTQTHHPPPLLPLGKKFDAMPDNFLMRCRILHSIPFSLLNFCITIHDATVCNIFSQERHGCSWLLSCLQTLTDWLSEAFPVGGSSFPLTHRQLNNSPPHPHTWTAFFPAPPPHR